MKYLFSTFIFAMIITLCAAAAVIFGVITTIDSTAVESTVSETELTIDSVEYDTVVVVDSLMMTAE